MDCGCGLTECEWSKGVGGSFSCQKEEIKKLDLERESIFVQMIAYIQNFWEKFAAKFGLVIVYECSEYGKGKKDANDGSGDVFDDYHHTCW